MVTEGEKTEVEYLQGLAQYLRATGASVRGLRSKGIGKDPLKVLQAALGINEADVEGFDEVWVVVDVDRHAMLPEALKLAAENSVPMVVSNPSFEIWLLWHYEDCFAHQSQRQLVDKLVEHGHAGKKVPGSFPYRDVEAAVKRANKLAVEHSIQGPNPSSAMPHLVTALQRRP